MLHHISCIAQNTRCRLGVTGVFFASILLLSTQCFSSPKHLDLSAKTLDLIQQKCLLGFDSPPPLKSPQSPYIEFRSGKNVDLTVPAEVIEWMSKQYWQQAYALWLEWTSDTCKSPEKSYELLLLHHYLIQTLKSLWPNLDLYISGWNKFPVSSDLFPLQLQKQFRPWPDDVIKNARSVDRLGMYAQDELLKNWETENEFAHWIECGSKENGMSINSVYGAMQLNGYSDNHEHNLSISNQKLDSYLFWKMIGWIDKSWMKYRMKTSKKMHDSDFQADLLNQCLEFNYWAEKAKKLSIPTEINVENQYLFSEGKLNPLHQKKAARLLGEVIEIKEARDQHYYKLDLKLQGIEPIWATGYTSVVKDQLKLGGRYVFIGEVKKTNTIDSNNGLSSLLNSDALLVARSIQTPK